MRIVLMKKINEHTPYWVKKPFSKIIRNKLIKNKEFLKTYSELKRYDSMNENEVKQQQIMMLKETLTHAYNHTSYYHKLFDDVGIDVQNTDSLDALKKVPVLTKENLKSHLDEMLADDIDDFYLVTTGGTSGEPIKVQMEKNAIYREWAFVYHYWSKYGYDFNTTKLATLRGVDLGDRLYEINPLYAEVRLNPFALSEKNIEKYMEIIDAYRADIIYGYPSAVYNFCRIAEKKLLRIKNRFKCVFLISENLYKFQEMLIKRVLGCGIAIFYGHSERAVFAEKYKQGYVFNDLYGVTELSENNEPIVTGFINGKTPLIRYLVDDQVQFTNEERVTMDSVNCHDDTLKKIKACQLNRNMYCNIAGHRDMEVLYGIDGQQISVAAINFHDKTFDKVSGYQFIQDKPGECTMHVAGDVLNQEDLVSIQEQVSRKIGSGVKCEVQYTDKLRLTDRGKYKMILQNYKPRQSLTEGWK